MKSPRSIAVLGLLLLAAILLPADSAAGAQVIKDGSFESTAPPDDNPNWEEGSLLFGTPICSAESCTGGGGTVGPRTGSNWVWFGGTPSPEVAFVSQEVALPPGPATLTFHLWLGTASGSGQDAFRVALDGTELLVVRESASGFGAYAPVTLDLAALAAPGQHELSFEYEGFGAGVTNFSLDDISLQAGELAAKSVTLSGPKQVAKGKKAKLRAAVRPCAGHQGDTIELFRGKKRIASASSNDSCAAVFKVRVKKTASYRAVSPRQDADHAAGSSKKLKVRAKSRRA